MRHFFPLIGLILFLSLQSQAQLLINEISPSNVSVIANADGEFDDWIELHNNTASSLNLLGYSLTDDSTKPDAFTFPSYSLEAGKKVLVFASDNTNRTIVNHWEMPLNAGSLWKYAQGSNSLDTNWRNPNFNDTPWQSGYGGIGFGDGDDNTTVPVCVSVMMRKTFLIPDTSQVLKAVLMLDYDDGFVAYLNGIEIARNNIGTTGYRPAWDALANYSHEAMSYRGLPIDSFYISPSLLQSAIRPGNNVLAIEVHNTPGNSDDLTSIPYLFFGMKSSGATYNPVPFWFHVPAKEFFSSKFKLSRNGESIFLYNPSGLLIDSKTYAVIENDNSFCRIPDGSSNWCITSLPTPEASNNGSICFAGYATPPVFSKQGGYYSIAQTISLGTNTPGGVIRYTTNGNTPTATSPVYTSPIAVASTKIIRARVFANNLLPSQLVTNTYIINGSSKLSTFSITTDSLNLWDYNTGIYVMGPGASATSPYKGANFWMDWEKPATIEYYDRNKNLVVNFNADIKIYGNYSRAKPQKSFEIKLKDSYGTGSFIYSLFPDKPYVDEISNIILRNSGTDWNKVHFRDAFMERVLKTTHTGYLAAEPAIAYLNGEYWGVYCIDENHDQHWMNTNYGLKRDEIDYIIESGSSIKLKEGSDSSYWSLYNYVTTTSPTASDYYEKINSKLDLKNYTDYFIAETFYNNGDWIGDWTNNIKMWRPNSPGSKWRYLVYDLDFGLGLYGDVNENRLSMARNPAAFSLSSEMFDAILKNPEYKTYFINRYADLMNTIFLPDNLNSVMHSLKDSMASDMTAHFEKWGSSTSNWNSEISDMMAFADARPDIMKNYIKSEFGLHGVVTLKFQTNPAGSGRIEISTVTPDTYPWTGDYFNGNPVTITAIPNPGYEFDHWKSQKVIRQNNPNQSVTYNFNKADVITAYFSGSATTPKICVSELNYNSKSEYNAGDWIELHNYANTSIDISGWRLTDGVENHSYTFPTGTTIGPNGYLVLVEDSAKFKALFPSVTNLIGETGFNFSNSGDQVRLYNHLDILYLSFYYQDLAPWPVQADGNGYTCELTGNTANPNNGSSWFAGCIGGSPGRAYNTTLSVPVSISGSTTLCTGSSTSLFASYFEGSIYQWKRNNTNIGGAVDSVFNATQAGTYTVNITNNGCSALTAPVNVITVLQQPDPVTTSATRCGEGPVTLTASSTDSVYWYEDPSGISLVGTGNTFNIPFVSQTKTYYAITGRNCSSNPVPAIAEIIIPSASPVCPDASRCGPGIVTLTATDTAEIRWYNSPSGGGLLMTGGSFTTNYLESDTTFFIEAGTVCPSSRIEVQVSILTTPDPVVTDASRCGNGTLTLAATSPANVYWYDAPSGGTQVGSGLSFTTPFLAVTDTFYAEANNGCPSARVAGMAMINPIPPEPVVTDGMICDQGSVTLHANATEQVKWYDAPSGGNLLYTGSNFTTPVINTTNTYYVSNGYTCQSNRVPVEAIVNSTPPPPVATDDSRCGEGTLQLNAASGDNIYWYDAPSGGNLIANGTIFNTPFLNVTTTYYAEAGEFCRSNRIAVLAIIYPVPPQPIATDAGRCGSGSFDLSVISAVPVTWYSQPGGNILATGNTYHTPFLTTDMTYYVSTNETCAGPPVAVNAFIYPLPVINLGPDTIQIPGGQTISLSPGTAFNSYQWSTGETVPEIFVASPGDYSVTITDFNGCSATDHIFVNMTTGINTDFENGSLKLFPNPAKGQFTIELSNIKAKNLHLKLISADGKIVRREDVALSNGQLKKVISLSGIAPGVYFLQMESDKFSKSIKVFAE